MNPEARYVEELNDTYNRHLQSRNERVWELEVINEALGDQVQQLMDERVTTTTRVWKLEALVQQQKDEIAALHKKIADLQCAQKAQK